MVYPRIEDLCFHIDDSCGYPGYSGYTDIHGLKEFKYISLKEVQKRHEEDSRQLNGFSHIMEAIFSYLELKDWANCRLVCQSWRVSIDCNLKDWYILQLKLLLAKPFWYDTIIWFDPDQERYPGAYYRPKRQMSFFLDVFPFWSETMEFFQSKKASLLKLKKFVEIMWHWQMGPDEFTSVCPVFSAILPETNYEILEFLHDETPLDFNKVFLGREEWTEERKPLLHIAIEVEDMFNSIHFLFESSNSKKVFDADIKHDEYEKFKRLHRLNAQFEREDDEDKYPYTCLRERLTALQRLVLNPRSENSKLISLFLNFSSKLNIDLNILNKDCQSLLHMLILPNPMKNDSLQFVTSTLETFLTHPESRKKMDFNATDVHGMTAFHYACAYGFLPEIKLFLVHSQELGIDLIMTNKRGETPLMLAKENRFNVENMESEIVPFLENFLMEEGIQI